MARVRGRVSCTAGNARRRRWRWCSAIAKELRQTVGVAPKSFARVTPLRWVMRRLIADHGTGLAQVALDHGFDDQTYMTREFTPTGQLTPAAYVRGGRRIRRSVPLVKRTVDRDAGRIEETVVSFGGQAPARAGTKMTFTARLERSARQVDHRGAVRATAPALDEMKCVRAARERVFVW
jgi:hypothetical protein